MDGTDTNRLTVQAGDQVVTFLLLPTKGGDVRILEDGDTLRILEDGATVRTTELNT